MDGFATEAWAARDVVGILERALSDCQGGVSCVAFPNRQLRRGACAEIASNPALTLPTADVSQSEEFREDFLKRIVQIDR